MNTNENLVIGLPAGSLADASRGGNLIDLLRHAGFASKGYESGGPSSFPVTSWIVGWDGRPQEFGSQLAIGEVDLAIGGDDWVRERVLEFKYEYDRDIELAKIMSLRRGSVRIVIITPREHADLSCDEWFRGLLAGKRLVTMVSEMPYIALEWFRAKARANGFGDSHARFSVQKFKTPPKIDTGIVIYETWGKTEAKVVNGSVDFGLEITQTGSAIRNYGLHIIDTIMESEAGIWCNPALKRNEAKYDLARMFLLNLYGSLHAEDKVLLSFNARNEAVPAVLDYLTKHNLFADEPTMNPGERFTEFSVQAELANPRLPLARVRYELARMGASGIETIPLESSIPNLGVIDF